MDMIAETRGNKFYCSISFNHLISEAVKFVSLKLTMSPLAGNVRHEHRQQTQNRFLFR